MRLRFRPLPRVTQGHPWLFAIVTALCTLLVAGSAGAAGWLRLTADAMAEQVFDGAAYPARQLQVYYAGVGGGQRIPRDADERLSSALPASVRALLEPPRPAVVVDEQVATALPRPSPYPIYLSVAGLQSVDAHVDVVAGRLPRPGARLVRLPPRLPDAQREEYEGPKRVRIVEVLLSRAAADAMQVSIGTYLDVSNLFTPGFEGRLPLLQISGLYEAAEPYPTPLDDVDNARGPAVSDFPEFPFVRATALTADVATVLQTPWPTEPEVRWTFDPAGVPTAAHAEAVIRDVRGLSVLSWPPVVESSSSAAATGIGGLADTFVIQRAVSGTVIALVLAALAGAALALLLAAAAVLESRRRDVIDVYRSRGAGSGRLAAMFAGEAALATAPGLLLAGLLVSVTPLAVADALPALPAAIVCVLLLAAAQVVPWRALPERVRLPAADASHLTVVLLVVLIGAVLWQRGDLEQTDPLLLVFPGLLGAAGAVVVVRIAALLARGVRRPLERSRGLTLVGVSLAGTTARHVVIPVGAVVLGVCAGLAALSVGNSVQGGAERSGWGTVGADVRITGTFDAAFVRRLERMPGVETVAAVYSVVGSLATDTGGQRVTVFAVDPAAMAEVTANGPWPVVLPESTSAAMGAVVTSDVDVAEAEVLLSYAQATMPVEVTERLDSVPGITDEQPFVVVDVNEFRRATDRPLLRAGQVLVAGQIDPATVREVARESWATATVMSRAEVEAEVLSEPVATRTLRIVAISALVSAALLLLATVLIVALGRPVRRRTAAVLEALGVDSRQRRWIGVVALAPTALGAAVTAVACALLLVSILTSGVDLAVVTGIEAGSR